MSYFDKPRRPYVRHRGNWVPLDEFLESDSILHRFYNSVFGGLAPFSESDWTDYYQRTYSWPCGSHKNLSMGDAPGPFEGSVDI